jgi:tetratricopeptide (TPR) repeat protein
MRALEEAAALDPRLPAAHMLLAQSYEEAKEYDKAIDRYRKILAVNPNKPVALNNLAYGLAVRKGQPAEAIGYAERALTLTRSSATVADTLAWVQHLLGRERGSADARDGCLRGDWHAGARGERAGRSAAAGRLAGEERGRKGAPGQARQEMRCCFSVREKGHRDGDPF